MSFRPGVSIQEPARPALAAGLVPGAPRVAPGQASPGTHRSVNGRACTYPEALIGASRNPRVSPGLSLQK